MSLVTGYEYDSNLALAPEIIGLGSGRDVGDSRGFVTLFSDYTLLEQADYNVGLIASQYGSFHFEENDFDVQDYMGGLYANALLTDDWMGGIRYEFHHTRFGGEHLVDQHRLVPNLTRFDNCGHTTLFYEFEDQQFAQRPLIPELDQDTTNHAIGLTRALYTGNGDGRLFYGYRFEYADADGSDFERTTNMVTARWEQPITTQFICDASVRYFWDNYTTSNSLDFEGRARRDNRLELRCGAQRTLSSNSGIRLDYTFSDSDSNTANLFGVRFYDFVRHVVSVQYIRTF